MSLGLELAQQFRRDLVESLFSCGEIQNFNQGGTQSWTFSAVQKDFGGSARPLLVLIYECPVLVLEVENGFRGRLYEDFQENIPSLEVYQEKKLCILEKLSLLWNGSLVNDVLTSLEDLPPHHRLSIVLKMKECFSTHPGQTLPGGLSKIINAVQESCTDQVPNMIG